MRLARPIYFTIAAGVITILISACSLAADVTPPPGYQEPTSAPTTNLAEVKVPAVSPDLTEGAALYAEKCAPCHGNTGQGDGPQSVNLPNPVTAIGSPEVARASKPADWLAVITNGKMEKMMPGFSGSLSSTQLWNVLGYVYSLSNPTQMIAEGKTLYTANCESCHGVSGKGDGTKARDLGTPPIDLSDPNRQSQITSQELYQVIHDGAAPDMPAFANQLSTDQEWSVVSYVRTIGGMISQGSLEALAPTSQPGTAATSIPSTVETPQATTETSGGTPAPTPAATGEVIETLTGKITNGSGSEVPGGMTVTLHGFDQMTEALTQTTTAGADGSFKFENIQVPSGRVFLASTEYQGVTFNSDIAHSSTTDPNILELPITIYDKTTDTSSLSVDRMHIFFDFSTGGKVQIVELYVVSNTGNKAVVADTGKAVLRYELPKGATDLQFQQGTIGDRYISLDNGFGDTESIAPGASQYQMMFAFDLAYTDKLDLNIPVTMPVNNAVVMLPKGGVQIKSSQLTDAGQQDVQGTSYQLFTATGLNAQNPLVMSLSGKGGSGTSQTAVLGGQNIPTLALGLGVFALALITAGLWLYYQRNQRAAKAVAGVGTEAIEAEGEDADTLMDAIVALDDQHKAGQLSEPSYQKRRAELKARLAQVLGKE